MKQVLIKSGEAIVSSVPAPHVSAGNVLIRVMHSCISVGTEMAGMAVSGLPLYQRALKQPENVKRVFTMMQEQGIKRTLDRVTGKLAAGSPTGYSAAGIVVAVGEAVEGFSVGDAVAAAGAGIANHAEYIDVPVNLALKIPENLSTEMASTVTLGAIAMQGVRRAQPTLGETFVVVGLGILGQITAQILSANGCRVIGVDLDENRIRVATENGLHLGIDSSQENYVQRVMKSTAGIGADGVIITAAASSHQIISDAMQATRKKGRVVLVGDVGLHLNRADFYQKELDFLISCSYGPGRYDPVYEEGGQDYPLPYVRWTENRNMQAYLNLLADKKISLDNFGYLVYPVDEATEAYNALKSSAQKPLMVLLAYPERQDALQRRITLKPVITASHKIAVAVAGASNFAQGVHLPNLICLREAFDIRAIMSRTGSTAKAVATQFQADYCTTDYAEILDDAAVDLVIIATRHDLHGAMVLQALEKGKHVFVEKPLTLNPEELTAIEAFYHDKKEAPLLMTGFNRRFAPVIQKMKALVTKTDAPMVINYTMNAGYIPLNHWVHGAEGGGRNLGEACHIYDLFNYLCGSEEKDVHAFSIDPASDHWAKNDNFIATIKYNNGSIATLTYTALGDKNYPKEKMEIFCDGNVLVMDDYKSLKVFGMKCDGWSAKTAQKGQLQELKMLAESLATGGIWPISLEEQIQATRIAFEVERQIFSK